MNSQVGFKKSQRGFTLIELMIAIVVLGILVGVALPSYQDSVRKARRASAQGELMTVANLQEQHLLTNRQYSASASAIGFSLDSDVAEYYSLTIDTSACTALCFTATLTPLAGSSQASDVTLSINYLGTKTPEGYW